MKSPKVFPSNLIALIQLFSLVKVDQACLVIAKSILNKICLETCYVIIL
jgi:hypothetical protein